MRRKFRNQLVNFTRALVFSVGVVIRRKLNVSLTIIVVSGTTSDVGKTSSIRSDGICQRKEKLVYTRLSVKKKREWKHRSSIILQLTSSSCTVSSVNLANANGMKFSGISTVSVNISQSRTVKQALKAAWRSITLVKKAIFTINVSKSNKVFQRVQVEWRNDAFEIYALLFWISKRVLMNQSEFTISGQAQATLLFPLY